MKFQINFMDLAFKKDSSRIKFSEVTYFFGKMGAGKSSIARLIDYCLGGGMELTPAMQTEFVSATLNLTIGGGEIASFSRERESSKIRVRCNIESEPRDFMIPARIPSGKIFPNQDIEVLSDLIFHLAGYKPPRVRRSKLNEESELQRLSFRDLLWYCYLDQSEIDSDFFHLQKQSPDFKSLKSRDVMRLLVGFYHEQIADVEGELSLAREKRLKYMAGIEGIREIVKEAELEDDLDISGIRNRLQKRLLVLSDEIRIIRDKHKQDKTDVMSSLQKAGRLVSTELAETEGALLALNERITSYTAHENELVSLATRFKRTLAARAILGDVNFARCPRCTRAVPERSSADCSLCGQSEVELASVESEATDLDIKTRLSELAELVVAHKETHQKLTVRARKLHDEKQRVDLRLNAVTENYDSQYLAVALEAERKHAAVEQELIDLRRIEILSMRIEEYNRKIHGLIADEAGMKDRLKVLKAKVEKDAAKLNRLKEFFLDTLVGSKMKGFSKTDNVKLSPPDFYPEISSTDMGALHTSSFGNISSGGKLTLFKCCFAIAVHRLSEQTEGILPSILIIDSPMKNISERENKDEFVEFHKMLYSLAETELKDTQIIIIDKEMQKPAEGFSRGFESRYMTPDVDEFPPLIEYYRGK
jgi:hypothetical protein